MVGTKDNPSMETVNGLDEFLEMAIKLGDENNAPTAIMLSSLKTVLGEEAVPRMALELLAYGFIIAGSELQGETAMMFSRDPQRIADAIKNEGRVIAMNMEGWDGNPATRQ